MKSDGTRNDMRERVIQGPGQAGEREPDEDSARLPPPQGGATTPKGSENVASSGVQEEPLDAWFPREREPVSLTGLRLTSLARRPAVVHGEDGLIRPAWVGSDPVLIDYYDQEWGEPVLDEGEMFELLSLLIFQAGLRWRTMLVRRSLLRAAFSDFSVDVLASWGREHADQLMRTAGVIHNRRKIESVIRNAAATRRLRDDGGLVQLVWSHQPDYSPAPVYAGDLPDRTATSSALASDLRRCGFTGVGPKSCFALMQAAGVVDANPVGAHKRGSSGLWDSEGNAMARPLL